LGATIMTSVLAAMNSQDTNSRGPSPLSSDKLTSTERIGDRVATVKNQTEGTGAQASHQNLSTSKSRILVPLVRLDAERQLVGGT
jgi:hypothetical protein